MKQSNLLYRFAVLVAAMMCALGAAAVEAYACYTSSNTTLTFYYDNYRSSRTGTTYDLNTGAIHTGWKDDGTYSNVTKVVFDPSFANARPTTTFGWFYKMENLQSITGMSYLNTSNVTRLDCMFWECKKMTSLDLSSFNTSKVTNMYRVFKDCTNLQTIYVGSGWSTAAVINASNMFENCTSLVGGQGTTFDGYHTGIDYAHIDGGPSSPGYFTEWKEAYACYTPSNTTLTFYYDNQRSSRTGTTYDLNTGSRSPGWYSDGTYTNVTKVVFDPSFAGARPTSTQEWYYMMTNLSSITGLSYLNTSQVTNMSWMFGFCTILPSLDVSSFNTANVTNMSCVFYGCASITSLNLSSFNTSKVTSMANLFRNCTNLQTIYAGNGWSTAAVTNSGYMFDKCNSLVGGQGTTWDRDKPKDKTYAHIDGGPSDPGYFTEWKEAYACYTPSNTTLTFYYDGQRSSRTGTTYDLNTGYNMPGWETDGYNGNVTKVVFDPSFANARPTSTYDWFYNMRYLQSIAGINYLNTSEVTNMSWMFGYCWSLTEVDVSRFSTANVTSMRSMFHACYHLSSLDLSNFNTANVNNMRNMFNACGVIQSLDLSSFNTSNVADMNGMFVDCALLRTVYVSDGWSTAAVTNSSSMFLNCSSLVGGRGTTYDASHTDAGYAHIDGGPGNPGYFSDKNASQRGDVDGDGNINITDVTVLIDCLLSGMTPPAAADCDQDGNVNITDVTVLIDYLLAGYW